MGHPFSKDGSVTQFFEHIPVIGYAVSAVQAIAGHPAEAQRAAARCTNETVKGITIAAAVALTPFEGPLAPAVWAAAGAAGDLAGQGIQAAIEEAYTDDDMKKEVQEEWDKDAGGVAVTLLTHIGIGAGEGLIAGGIGTIVDGAYPAASAEMEAAAEAAEVADSAEMQALGGRSWAWTEEGEAEATAGRRVAGAGRRGAIVVQPTRSQTVAFLLRKPSNFISAFRAGRKIVLETFLNRRGLTRYCIKKFGVSAAQFIILDAPISAGIKGNHRSLLETNEEDEASTIRPLFAHVQGGLSKNGLPAILGQMHIATTAVEAGDFRDAQSSYAYTTHSPTERALLYVEDSKDGSGFHIRVSGASGGTSKDRYLAVANNHSGDRRDDNSLYVNAHDGYPGATWALELYEEKYAVFRLVSPGTMSGAPMKGGYLVAHSNLEKDRRNDGGCYLSIVHSPKTDNPVASIFGFRFMHPDRLWWMDVVGDYECHKYDGTPAKNGYHRVRVSESVDHQGLYWMNEAKISWSLTPQVGPRGVLLTQNDCVYYESYKECDVVFDSDQNVIAVMGPSNERYERVWWRDLEGMVFEENGAEGEPIIVARDKDWAYMKFKFRSGESVRARGEYKLRDIMNSDSGAQQDDSFSVLRNSFGLITGLMWRRTSWSGGRTPADGMSAVGPAQKIDERTFHRYSFTDLLGRYVTQRNDSSKKRTVSTYMRIHGSLKEGSDEVWWQSTNGETWSLRYASRNKLYVGPTCPYLKDGYKICKVNRNSEGEVASLVGPKNEVFKLI
mmetsp:Transcript_4080/g.5972  ORF Transcript_4080/g.5972 Transcript_4080/m.5972 type:complete len:781 (+) Transcript_4080:315-2657(+)